MLVFTAAVFLLIITPGPGVLSTAGVGAAFGWRHGLFYVGGLCVGTNMVGLAVISGLAAVIFAEPVVRTVLLFASSGYLGYLALRISLAGSRIAFIRTTAPGFFAGLTLQFINPKAYAVNTALFSSFAFYPASFAVETALKLIIMNIVWLPVHLAWLYAGVKVNSLDLPPHIQRAINLGMAACLLAVVILSVWSVTSPSVGSDK
ncbi:MAG: LysE family translocator [Pseudomonadota bacterium]|nr:LysE family translocator [Pseudomonadota bacterium]